MKRAKAKAKAFCKAMQKALLYLNCMLFLFSHPSGLQCQPCVTAITSRYVTVITVITVT